MRIALTVMAIGLAAILAAAGASYVTEHQRLERLAAERDANAEQNRLNFIEFERQQRAIPAPRPMGKPLPGQRDA